MALLVMLLAVQLPRAAPEHSSPAPDMLNDQTPLVCVAFGHVRRRVQSAPKYTPEHLHIPVMGEHVPCKPQGTPFTSGHVRCTLHAAPENPVGHWHF